MAPLRSKSYIDLLIEIFLNFLNVFVKLPEIIWQLFRYSEAYTIKLFSAINIYLQYKARVFFSLSLSLPLSLSSSLSLISTPTSVIFMGKLGVLLYKNFWKGWTGGEKHSSLNHYMPIFLELWRKLASTE